MESDSESDSEECNKNVISNLGEGKKVGVASLLELKMGLSIVRMLKVLFLSKPMRWKPLKMRWKGKNIISYGIFSLSMVEIGVLLLGIFLMEWVFQI